MANIVIADGRRFDAASITTSGSIVTAMPLANLQDIQPGKVARWNTLSSVNVTASLASAYAVNVVAAVGNNFSSAATWRVRGANSLASVTSGPGYDSSTISVWPTTGIPAADSFTSLLFMATAQTFQYWRIDVNDAANADSYVEAGRIYISDAWQPTVNVQYGWAMQWIDPSPKELAVGGQMYVNQVTSHRVLGFSLDFLGEDEMFNSAYELGRLRGSKKDALVIRDPTGTTHLHRQMIYGLFRNLAPIVNTTFNIYQQRMEVEELIP